MAVTEGGARPAETLNAAGHREAADAWRVVAHLRRQNYRWMMDAAGRLERRRNRWRWWLRLRGQSHRAEAEVQAQLRLAERQLAAYAEAYRRAEHHAALASALDAGNPRD